MVLLLHKLITYIVLVWPDGMLSGVGCDNEPLAWDNGDCGNTGEVLTSCQHSPTGCELMRVSRATARFQSIFPVSLN